VATSSEELSRDDAEPETDEVAATSSAPAE
jgi:hypothetical protein